jgi:hypothetical protein
MTGTYSNYSRNCNDVEVRKNSQRLMNVLTLLEHLQTLLWREKKRVLLLFVLALAPFLATPHLLRQTCLTIQAPRKQRDLVEPRLRENFVMTILRSHQMRYMTNGTEVWPDLAHGRRRRRERCLRNNFPMLMDDNIRRKPVWKRLMLLSVLYVGFGIIETSSSVKYNRLL